MILYVKEAISDEEVKRQKPGQKLYRLQVDLHRSI
jgi:hypothetical protein